MWRVLLQCSDVQAAQRKKPTHLHLLCTLTFFEYNCLYVVTFANNNGRKKPPEVTKVLTQAVKIQGPRRWCLPSLHEPWRCPSEARFRHPSPSPQTRRDGWAFRSPGGPRGRWSHVVRCWSRGSGCNMWARRLTQSHSLLPTLQGRGVCMCGGGVRRGDIITINLQLPEKEPRADKYVDICVDHYLFLALLTCDRSYVLTATITSK